MQRKEAAKSDIVLKALHEQSDLDALRREKRAILEEEKRLKALLDIEKTQTHRKQDMLAAQRAERQRHASKTEYRRDQNMQQLREHARQERELAIQKTMADGPVSDTW